MRIAAGAPGARELLVSGVALVGLSVAVSALPALIQGIGTAG